MGNYVNIYIRTFFCRKKEVLLNMNTKVESFLAIIGLGLFGVVVALPTFYGGEVFALVYYTLLSVAGFPNFIKHELKYGKLITGIEIGAYVVLLGCIWFLIVVHNIYPIVLLFIMAYVGAGGLLTKKN